jgi:hypothetical protein
MIVFDVIVALAVFPFVSPYSFCLLGFGIGLILEFRK